MVYRSLLSIGMIRELPVSNVLVMSAVGRKTTTVKKQVFLCMEIGEIVVEHVFLIIPNLTTDMIG